jgi:hypothetical protein
LKKQEEKINELTTRVAVLEQCDLKLNKRDIAQANARQLFNEKIMNRESPTIDKNEITTDEQEAFRLNSCNE